jgi:hypothetical protein
MLLGVRDRTCLVVRYVDPTRVLAIRRTRFCGDLIASCFTVRSSTGSTAAIIGWLNHAGSSRITKSREIEMMLQRKGHNEITNSDCCARAVHGNSARYFALG